MVNQYLHANFCPNQTAVSTKVQLNTRLGQLYLFKFVYLIIHKNALIGKQRTNFSINLKKTPLNGPLTIGIIMICEFSRFRKCKPSLGRLGVFFLI